MRSIAGERAQIASANRISLSVGKPKDRPLPGCARTAATNAGLDKP
jgi:hypothetical protein